MFTGIVRARGRVAVVDGDDAVRRLEIDAPSIAAELAVGDSVSLSASGLPAGVNSR